jgi:hypothetical protein
VSVLVDESEQAGKSGTRFHVVRAGERKGSGGAPVPVSESELAEAQLRVNALHEVFMADVARGRNVAVEAVRPVADGRIFTGKQAVEAGLVDGIATMDAVMAMLGTQDNLFADKGQSGVPSGQFISNVAAGDKESEMSESKTPPAQAVDAEAIKATAVKEANEAAAKRVKELTAVLGGRTELLTKAIAEGMDVTTAKAALADVLATENKTLGEQLIAANGKVKDTETELANLKELVAKSGIKPLAIGGKDSSTSESDDDGKTYEQAVAERETALIAGGVSKTTARAQAYRDVARDHPKLHAAWKKNLK